MQLGQVQQCHLGTGMIIRHSVFNKILSNEKFKAQYEDLFYKNMNIYLYLMKAPVLNVD